MKQEVDERNSEETFKKEGQSVFRVEVLRLPHFHGILHVNDPGKKVGPYADIDSTSLYRPYQVYMLSWSEVMMVVMAAVKSVDNIYCIRVSILPLGILMDNRDTFGVRVFSSKGEEIRNSTDTRFKPGEIVEYYDSKYMKIRLAVVYKIIDNTEEGDRDGNQRGYRLLTRMKGLNSFKVQPSDVSVPHFAVSKTFRKELKTLYRKKLEHIGRGIDFDDLFDLL